MAAQSNTSQSSIFEYTDDERRVAADVEAKAIEWLWADRIPKGMLTLIAGRPGQGKSMFSVHLAAEMSKRGEHVIFSNKEDPEAEVIRPRLEAAGADLNCIHFWNFVLPEDTAALRYVIDKVDAKLVIADPIAAHLKPSVYQDQDVRTALTPLTAMLAETGTAFVAIHHTKKSVSKNSHPLESIGGAGGGLPGAARAVFIWGESPDDNDERVLAPVKCNVAEMRPSVTFEIDSVEVITTVGITQAGLLVEQTRESHLTASEVLQSNGNGGDKQPVKKALAAEWLTTQLGFGKQQVTDLKEAAAALGLSWRTMRRAQESIGVVKSREGFGKGSKVFWELPPGHPAILLPGGDDDQAADTDNPVNLI